jgi:hypothetical protein
MYLVSMDRLAQEDIAAAAAVHHELGRDYDGAVAEGLIERIGSEIDKRVDAKLGHRDAARPSRPRQPGSIGFGTAIVALGSIGIGGIVSANIMSNPRSSAALVAFIWVVIAVINVAYARRH